MKRKFFQSRRQNWLSTKSERGLRRPSAIRPFERPAFFSTSVGDRAKFVSPWPVYGQKELSPPSSELLFRCEFDSLCAMKARGLTSLWGALSSTTLIGEA